MATVDGLTKARMLAIEAASVVDGEVVGDNLILTRHDGTSFDAGDVRGPAGSGGGSGGNPEEKTFAAAANDWIWVHNRGTKALSVYTEDTLGKEITGDITFPNENTVKVHFYFAKTGFMRIWE